LRETLGSEVTRSEEKRHNEHPSGPVNERSKEAEAAPKWHKCYDVINNDEGCGLGDQRQPEQTHVHDELDCQGDVDGKGGSSPCHKIIPPQQNPPTRGEGCSSLKALVETDAYSHNLTLRTGKRGKEAEHHQALYDQQHDSQQCCEQNASVIVAGNVQPGCVVRHKQSNNEELNKHVESNSTHSPIVIDNQITLDEFQQGTRESIGAGCGGWDSAHPPKDVFSMFVDGCKKDISGSLQGSLKTNRIQADSVFVFGMRDSTQAHETVSNKAQGGDELTLEGKGYRTRLRKVKVGRTKRDSSSFCEYAPTFTSPRKVVSEVALGEVLHLKKPSPRGEAERGGVSKHPGSTCQQTT
jgi:hypothetical protein